MNTLKERFERSVRDNAERTAIHIKRQGTWQEVSYGDLSRKVDSLGSFLSEEGIKKGDRIALLMKNRLEWPVVFFGAAISGIISVPINPGSTLEETKNIIKDSECSIIFTDGNLIEFTEEVRRECPSVEKIISVDSKIFENALKIPPGDKIHPAIGPDNMACILYTSGTTASPKGVMLTHGNLVSNCDSQYKLNIVRNTDSVTSILPLQHAYPLTVTMILPLLSGSRIAYPATMRPEDIQEAITETKATVFVAVPQIFSSVYQRIDEAVGKMFLPVRILVKIMTAFLYRLRKSTKINLSRWLFRGIHKKFGRSLRFFVSGGAKLDEDVAWGLFKYGFTVLEGYGLTETSPVLSMNPPKKEKIGSVGRALPDVELKIADKNEKDIGEVLARGPNIMKGYYKRKDATDSVIKGGWFHTGDLGYIDEEGYLFLTGRKKDVIVMSSGVNVYPEEVEEVYGELASVKEICVFDVPVKRGKEEGTALWAVVVPDLEYFKKYGEIYLKEGIKERFKNISNKLPSHMHLMGFSITLDELPRTLLGKVKRFALREEYSAKTLEEGQGPKEEPSAEDLEILEKGTGEKITKYLAKQTGLKRKIIPSDFLELDLGVDSLRRIELASALENIFGVEIKDEILGEAFTVRDLILGVEGVLSGGAPLKKATGEGPPLSVSWAEVLKELPREENLGKIDLKPGFISWLGGFIFMGIVKMIFRIFYSLKVEGRENLPAGGAYILYANHTSYLDGLIVASALPETPKLDMFFVGFRPYFNVPIVRNLVKIGRVIPLDFSTHLLESMKSSFYVLKNGKALCLFPEGMRSLDGKLLKFRKGFGILSKESDAKLVPLVIKGAFEAWPRDSKFPKRYPIKVKIGKALEVKRLEEEGLKMGAEDSYEAICKAAQKALFDVEKT
ncbi:AMP-binding protein [Candidatus Omnitrophota bacterium]